MEYQTSRVYRELGVKVKVFGMEANDLLLVLIFSSVANLFFGHTSLKLWFSFVLPLVLAIVLFICKRGRPEHYLIHVIRYYLIPKSYSAGAMARDEQQRRNNPHERI